MLPILHLNGYKIANPTVLARIPEERAARAASRGYGYEPVLVDGGGDEPPMRVHQRLAAALDDGLDEIARDPATRRATGGVDGAGRAGR